MAPSIDAPTPTDSVTQRHTTPKASLYHTCRSVLDSLAAVPGFEVYLADDNESHTIVDHRLPSPSATANNPLSKLWHICRQGTSLCLLFNTLMPESPIPLPLTSSANKPKACVYHFIIACRDQLGFSHDDLFTVTELYQDDTNGFVKVVNTLTRILDLLHDKGCITLPFTHTPHADPNAPRNMRDKIVAEFLKTERKYVQDLEQLQNYMREAQAQKIVSADILHQLFGNLNALVDFQRRFLIQVEENADQPPEEQRFGSMFIHLEDAFVVYEPFCANFQVAQNLVLQEADKLQKLSSILSPTYELPSLLIKPVQRVCKYPLLIQEMLKETPSTWAYHEEMKEGLKSIQRVASKVNETKRQQENMLIVQDLKRKVENWKEPIDTYGPLLLQDRFTVTRRDTGRDMLVFLFEKALLFCKDDKDASKKTNAKSMKKKKKDGSLTVSEQIPLAKIAQITDTSQQGQFTLRILWSENDQQRHNLQAFNLLSYVMNCRNAELLSQWESALNKHIQLAKRSAKEQKPLKLNTTVPTTPVDQDALGLSASAEKSRMDASDGLPKRGQSYPQGLHVRQRTGESDGGCHRRREDGQNAMALGGVNHTAHTMKLPPLPPPEISPVDSSTPVGPLSYPPSPTYTSCASTRTSTGSTGSSNPWSRRFDNASLPAMPTEPFDPYGVNGAANVRSDSQLVSEPFNRLRSQSSPNIYACQQEAYPCACEAHPCRCEEVPKVPLSAHGRSTPQYQHRHGQQSSGTVKIKLNYENSIYVVLVPLRIQYMELVERIERKIGYHSHGTLSLKYQDEDGDFITISSNEDVQLGFESRGANNTLNLHVTC